MSWRHAPLYVEAHDLARWIGERSKDWPADARGSLGSRLVAAACDLLVAVALALTFPRPRRRHLETADEAIVHCRTLLRVARDVGLLSPGGARFAAGRLREIGRMVGGWRKKLERRPGRAAAEQAPGDGPPPAGGA